MALARGLIVGVSLSEILRALLAEIKCATLNFIVGIARYQLEEKLGNFLMFWLPKNAPKND